jgi:tRNA threonylcarbamoyl adenosine modification protein (Sua5/YciO/YrdC/YwlC family)
MSPLFDCRDEAQLLSGMRQARQAIGRGELVVLPTDTVYGVAADAFSARAVQGLLEAKGRGRQSPPPVLVAGVATLRALVAEVPEAVERLVEAFWPGGLTIVLPSQPSLSWDLGDTFGTVAVRMPANNLALELLEETGPLAVSSANLTGQSAAITAAEAQGMLGDSVAVYLDGGPSTTGVASTIIDATSLVGGGVPLVRVLREGAIDRAALREVLGDLLEPDPVREELPGLAPEPARPQPPAPDAVGADSDAPQENGSSGRSPDADSA